jgi:ribosomal protein S18 acetylase RimI-like enzyme
MAKSLIQPTEISFRPARVEDAKVAGGLLFDTFPKVATFIIGLGNEDRARAILTRIFAIPGHRFSYEETILAVYKGRVVGLLTSYPGKRLTKIDRKSDRLILKQYRIRGKLALIIRFWPMLFMNETRRDEYLIGNLAVRARYRSRGIGRILLEHAEHLAGEAGLKKLALRVAIENLDARKLYESFGFETKAMYLESNRRVKYVGAGYRRMVKTLS